MLRTNLKPWLVLTHFLIPALHCSLSLSLSPPPPIVPVRFFVCNLCSHPSLNSMIKQNSNFQEFNSLSIWVLLLRDSCNWGYFALSNVLDVCELNLFSFCFWVIWTVIIGSKWHDDRASSYESGVEFDGVKCLLNWIFFSLSLCFGSFGRWSSEAPNGRLTKQSKSIWVKCGIQWHTKKACSELLMGMPPKANKEPIMWRTTCCSYLSIERRVVRMWSS